MRRSLIVGGVAVAAILAWPSGEAQAQVISIGYGNTGYASPYGYGGYPGVGYNSGYLPTFGNVYRSQSYYGGGFQQPYYGGYRTSGFGYGNPGYGYGRGYGGNSGYGYGRGSGYRSGWRR